MVDNILYIYDEENDSVKEVKLPYDNPSKLHVSDGKIYVIYSDVHGESNQSYIQEYNPTDHKLESAISYKGTIHQLIIQDRTYCIMDFNTINFYYGLYAERDNLKV